MSGIQIESIPSVVPDWFDPHAPDFKPPNSWSGAIVRVKVTISSADPTKEMAEARAILEKKYPGAVLHLLQETDASYPASDPGAGGTDEDMLRAYFATVQMPEGSTTEQAVAYLGTMLPGSGLFGVQSATFINTHASNVLCFERAFIDMTKKGLTLVTGVRTDRDGKSNGSGKSSFVGLPFLGITGKTLKGQDHNEWACRFNKLPTSINTMMRLADGRQLIVSMQRRPGKLTATLDGRDVTMGTPAATQKYIEQLTNLTWDVITNAVYIGQHEASTVFGTDKERKELFSRLLGLNRFLDVQAKLRRVSLRLTSAASEIETDRAAASAAMTEAQHGRSEIIDALKSAPKVDATKMTALARLVESDKKKQCNNDVTMSKLADDREELTKRIRTYEAEINATRGELNALRRQLMESERVKSICVTCGATVSRSTLATYLLKQKRGISTLETRLADLDDKTGKLRVQRSRIDESDRLCASESVRLNTSVTDGLQKLAELKEIKASHDALKAALADKDARTDRWRKLMNIHERARKATLMEKAFIDTCASACGRDGMPAFLYAAAVPRLNAASAVFCDAFESDVAVRFDATSDGVDVVVVNEDGGGSHKDQSKGESSLAGIIASLSFRDALVPLGVLILDEPGEGLDDQSAAAFARGMNKVAARFGSAYVITHNPSIAGTLEPDHHIEIVKTGKISTVREVV